LRKVRGVFFLEVKIYLSLKKLIEYIIKKISLQNSFEGIFA